MEAVLLRGLDQSASRATSSVERANEKLGIEYSSRPTWTHQADRREAERRTPRTARPAARATSRGLTPLARPRVRTSARAKRALGDRACLIMRISSSSAWTRPRTSLWRGIARLEAGYHRRRGRALALPRDSALRDVLPVDVAGIPAEGPRAFSTDSFKPRLTAAGRNHPVTSLSLDPKANEARWAALPPLQGINRVARLQPGATALLVHPGQSARAPEERHQAARPQGVLNSTGSRIRARASLAVGFRRAWHVGIAGPGSRPCSAIRPSSTGTAKPAPTIWPAARPSSPPAPGGCIASPV